MGNWNRERVKITTAYTPMTGHFGIGNPGRYASIEGADALDASNWYSCRDAFLQRQHEFRYFYFCHGRENDRGAYIAKFMEKIEDQIKLPVEERSKYRATRRSNIIQVTPGPFWNNGKGRQSLFSALLRCAMAYDVVQDNFEAALWSRHYTNMTKYAVKRFLKGYTKIRGHFNYSDGWTEAFREDTFTWKSKLRAWWNLSKPRRRNCGISCS